MKISVLLFLSFTTRALSLPNFNGRPGVQLMADPELEKREAAPKLLLPRPCMGVCRAAEPKTSKLQAVHSVTRYKLTKGQGTPVESASV